MRGLAAMAVAQHHFFSWNSNFDPGGLGVSAVFLFFALSATSLMLAYADTFGTGISYESLRAFYVSRVARILPLLALMAAIMAALSIATRGWSTEHALRSLLTGTALMGLHLPGFDSTVTGAWSLGIEAAFYAVFPVIAIVAASCSTRALAMLGAVLIAGQLALFGLIADKPMVEHWHHFATPLMVAPFFFYGLVAWRLAGLAIHAGWSLALVAAMAFVAISTDPLHDARALVALSLIIAGAIFAARSARLPTAWRPVAAFLANISYALYLSHRFVHELIAPLGLPLAVRWLAFMAVSSALAWFLFRFVEQPARDWLRRSLLGQPDPDETRIQHRRGVAHVGLALDAQVGRGVADDRGHPAVG